MAVLKNQEHCEDNHKRKWEIVDGVITLMSPSPGIYHNIVKGNIFALFHNHLKGKPCKVFTDNTDVKLNQENTYVPNVSIVCDKSKYQGKNAIYGAPDLVVEILSPRTSSYDRGRKKEVYGASGVKEYWLVDVNNLTVEVYLQQNGHLVMDEFYTIITNYETEKLEQKGEPLPPKSLKTTLFDDLTIYLEEVFEDVYKEILGEDS
ncbi:MAG: Uma2 family endonuclease [Defluviitaleaceae bacterium]|nr:Uma2 family endonuclease [Defluviitaleaceae bacterium]